MSEASLVKSGKQLEKPVYTWNLGYDIVGYISRVIDNETEWCPTCVVNDGEQPSMNSSCS